MTSCLWHYLRDPTFSHIDIIPECDRHTHTNGKTHDDGIYALNIASHGKNRPYCTAHQV